MNAIEAYQVGAFVFLFLFSRVANARACKFLFLAAISTYSTFFFVSLL